MGNSSKIYINFYMFMSSWLVMLGAWTILIKYVFPVIYSLVYQQALTANIMWDFWWVAHFWLAYSFLIPSRKTFVVGMIIAISEFFIITYKLAVFYFDPVWNIWQTNWLINKIFVLFTFIMIIGLLLKNRKELLSND